MNPEKDNNHLKDITRKYEETEKLLEEVRELAELGYWKWDIQSGNVYWSPEVYKIFGFNQKEFTPNIDAIMERSPWPEDRERNKELIEKAAKNRTKGTYEQHFYKKDGSEGYYRSTFRGIYNENDEVIGIHGTVMDITKEKLAEKELIKTNKKLQDIKDRYDMASEIGKIGTWDWDILSGDLFWNDVTYELLGFEPGSVEPSYELYQETLYEDDKEMIDKAVKDAWYNKADYSIDHRIVTPKGEIRYCNTSGKVEYDKDDNPVRMLGTYQDITERKRFEEELLKAKEQAEESDYLKSEFLHNMSHEIRTPMNGIVGFTEMLQEDFTTEEERQHYISVIQSSCFQLTQIIDDILEISFLETGQMKMNKEVVDLNELLMEQFSIFTLRAKQKNIQLYLKKGLDDARSRILSDKVKLQKILNNILENAFKYTAAGFIEFGYQLKKDKIELYVKDTGIGIRETDFNKIFVRFSRVDNDFSKKTDGLGLGLSIAKENTELLGGKISLISEEGMGTTFFIEIPYKPLWNEDLSNSETDEQDVEILIAEDEAINFLYLETLITKKYKNHCTLFHAKNGEEAVRIFKDHKDISAILMDLKMPVMDGYEATRIIKSIRPEVPIIVQTAYSTKEDKQKALALGCNGYITKPSSSQIIIQQLEKFIPSFQ